MALATWLEYSQTRARFQPDPTQPDPFTALLLIGLGGPIVCFLASVAGGWGPVNRQGAAGALFAVGAWLLWSTGWRMGLPVDTGWSVLSAAGALVAIIAGTLFSLSRTPGKIERPRSETIPQPSAEGSPAIIDLDSLNSGR
jgi:hypothetical protein